LGELCLSLRSEAAYRQLRAVVKDRARDIVELEVESGRGQMLCNDQSHLLAGGAPQVDRDMVGAELFDFLVGKLQKFIVKHA
jgi:hypothetical protein